MNPGRGSRCSGAAGPVHGFTLIEMAVVLAIVGFILGGLLVPLRTQFDAARYDTVRAQLRTAEEALIGYAVANGGRLPCPVTDDDDLTTPYDDDGYCNPCFTGKYPINVGDAQAKLSFEGVLA